MKASTLFVFGCGIFLHCVYEAQCMPPPDANHDEDIVKNRRWRNDETESSDGYEAGGFQTSQHNGRLGAIVFKPSSFRSGGREYYRSNWRRNMDNNDTETRGSEEIENNTLSLLKGLSGPFFKSPEETEDSGVFGGEEQKHELEGRVDPLDPEEAEREKQEVNGYGFSKILSINQELGVEGVTEGDMRFSMNRNAAGDSDLWPKSKTGSRLVPIPYKISNAYNKTEVTTIKSAMDLYTRHTCIRFVPRSKEIAYIYITDGKGCWAYVGKTGYSAQTVSLGRPGCVAKGIAAHELMHVVGFQHEHSRSDRDKYVTILEHNIQRDMKSNFDRYNNTKNLVIYDYNSVMHYSKNAFSKFQYLPAIQINPKRKPEPSIGQRERMSPYDIEEIKYLYNCASNTYQRCGMDFVNRNSGQIKSPRYPNNYLPESHCTWSITVPKGKYISITFSKIDLEDSPLCQKDAILIHDGANAAAPQLKTLCGTVTKSITVTSTGNSLFVMFTSDPVKSSFTGFEAYFRTTSNQGVLPTPYTIPKLKHVANPINQFTCNFETGTCGMSQDTLDELDWIRYKGRTPSHGTGPSADHTTGSGYYMYVESSLPSKVGDNAILRTPWLSRTSNCISFSFHMLGTYMGTLRLYAFEKRKKDGYGHEVLLWEKHGNQGNQWITESVPYKPTKNVERVQYYWEAFVFFYQSDIGLDDISIRNQPCHDSQPPNKTPPRVQVVTRVPPTLTNTKATTHAPTAKPSATTHARTTASKVITVSTHAPVIDMSPRSESVCDFEKGLCEWTQDNNDHFDWTRTDKGTPSHNTGPTMGDHTMGNGHFLYIEASTPRVEGDVARLLSPPLTRKPHCLKIWYHMYGAQMGTLLITQITDGVEAKLIEKVGNKGDSWFLAVVDIITPSVKTSGKRVTKGSWQNDYFTQIAIDGIRGSGYPGDLAIDDISITSSACAEVPATVTPGLESHILCEFDILNDQCGFTDSDSDSFDWAQIKGETPSKSTGPTDDHTKGDETGYYMYIEASSPHAKGDNAKLTSPKFRSGSYCVKFYAHMWGSGMGSFKVYTLEYVDSENEFQRTRWELTGSQGRDWFKAEFEFETAINIKYVQLEFEAIIGPSFTSDIALDDIEISPGLCTKKIGTTKTIGTELFSTKKPTTTLMMTSTTATTKMHSSKPTSVPPTTAAPLTALPSRAPASIKLVKTTSIKTTVKKQAERSTQPTQTTSLNKITTAYKEKSTAVPATPSTPKRTQATSTRAKIVTTSKKVKTTSQPQPTTLMSTTNKASLKTSQNINQFTCDFESGGLCGLVQSDSDKFDWILNSGNTPSSGTGPSFDHSYRTRRKGHYLFIEGSSPRAPFDNAVIITPTLSATASERCVVFWYHMYGDGIGDLKVYSKYSQNGIFRKQAGNLSRSKLEFEISGNHGNEWQMAQFTVRRRSHSSQAGLQIFFKGVIGKKFRSDIAIDDICITDGPCTKKMSCRLLNSQKKRPVKTTPRVTTIASGRTVTKTSSRPSVQPVTVGGSKALIVPLKGLEVQMRPCPFDLPVKKTGNSKVRSLDSIPVAVKSQGRDLGSYELKQHNKGVMCGWEQDKTGDQFDWKRQSDATPSQFTGPKGDHTTGKGHYLFIESSVPRVFNDMAILKSKKMFPTTYCMSLFYNMYGKGVGTLQVRSQEKLGDGSETVRYLKAIRGEQGEAWGRLEITYKPKKSIKSVQFRIEGIRGKDYMGDIAIDDLEISPGRCGACSKPNQQYTNQWRQKQRFSTGCVTSSLFYVKCCSLADEKHVFRRVLNCTPSMYTPNKLDLMCNYM